MIKDTGSSTEAEIRIIARGAGIIFLGTIAGVALKYVFELILARSLGPDLFGIFFLGFSIFKILERISVFGLHNGVLRYVSVHHGTGDNKRLKGVILLGILAVIIISAVILAAVLPLSGIISARLFKEPGLTGVLIIFSIILIFNAVTEIVVSSIQGIKIMKYKVFVRMLAEPGLRIFLAALFIWAGFGLMGAAAAYALSLLAGMFLSFYYLKKVFPYFFSSRGPYRFESGSLFGFSWPLAFVGFFNIIILQINAVMLGYYGSSGDVGVFGAVQRTALVIQVVLTSFNAVFAPVIADLYNKKRSERLEKLYKIVTNWIFIISFPIFLLMVLYPEELLGIWGPGYRSGWISLVIISASMMINCAVGSVKNMIMMSGRSRLNLANEGIAFFITIILNILLIPEYGVMGAAISFAAAVVISNAAGLLEVYFLLGIHPYKISFLKPFAAGIISAAVFFLLKKYVMADSMDTVWLIIMAPLFLLMYTGLLFVFKFSREDLMVLDMIRQKLFKKNNRDRKNDHGHSRKN